MISREGLLYPGYCELPSLPGWHPLELADNSDAEDLSDWFSECSDDDSAFEGS
jgi:hypothetical protein